MSYVIAALIIAGIAGVVAYKRLPAVRAKVDALLAKKGTSWSSGNAASGPTGTPTDKPIPGLTAEAQTLDEYLASLPPSTRAHIPQGAAAEYRDELVRRARESGTIDRSGFDLRGEHGDGWYVVNNVANGQHYMYRYYVRPGSKMAQIAVFGAEGGQVNRVNGVDVISRQLLDVPAEPGEHLIPIRVEGVGMVGVQFVQA